MRAKRGAAPGRACDENCEGEAHPEMFANRFEAREIERGELGVVVHLHTRPTSLGEGKQGWGEWRRGGDAFEKRGASVRACDERWSSGAQRDIRQ